MAIITTTAVRAATLLGKTAVITAGVLIGTMAVSKGIQLYKRLDDEREDGKDLKTSIKDLFKRTEGAAKEFSEDVTAAAKAAAAEVSAAAKQAKDEVAAKVDDAKQEASAEAGTSATKHDDAPSHRTEAPIHDQPMGFEEASQHIGLLLKTAQTYGFMGNREDLMHHLMTRWTATNEMPLTISELTTWARHLHATTAGSNAIANYGDLAFQHAKLHGYGGNMGELYSALYHWAYASTEADPGFTVSLSDVQAWAKDIGERDKQEQTFLANERIARQVHDEDVRAEAQDPTRPADPVAPVQAPASTGESLTADLSTNPAPAAAAPAASSSDAAITEAGKAKVDGVIEAATKAAAEKTASKSRRVSQPGTSSSAPKDDQSK